MGIFSDTENEWYSLVVKSMRFSRKEMHMSHSSLYGLLAQCTTSKVNESVHPVPGVRYDTGFALAPFP